MDWGYKIKMMNKEYKKPQKIIIIGLNIAGITAAKILQQKLPNATITAYEKNAGDNLGFMSAGIPLLISGKVKDPKDLFLTTVNDLKSKKCRKEIKK